jgi:hypothetical protein
MLRSFDILPSLVLLLNTLPAGVLASQILKTTGFSTCLLNPDITVQNVDVEYDNSDQVSTKSTLHFERISI